MSRRPISIFVFLLTLCGLLVLSGCGRTELRDRCVTNGDCDPGSQCVNQYCEPAEVCVDSTECPGVDVCVGGLCTPPADSCVTSEDCADNEFCENGVCQPDEGETCEANSDCQDGEFCDVDGTRSEERRVGKECRSRGTRAAA